MIARCITCKLTYDHASAGVACYASLLQLLRCHRPQLFQSRQSAASERSGASARGLQTPAAVHLRVQLRKMQSTAPAQSEAPYRTPPTRTQEPSSSVASKCDVPISSAVSTSRATCCAQTLHQDKPAQPLVCRAALVRPKLSRRA